MKKSQSQKSINIRCAHCDQEFSESVPRQYEFNYEDFTCPNCNTYENLMED